MVVVTLAAACEGHPPELANTGNLPVAVGGSEDGSCGGEGAGEGTVAGIAGAGPGRGQRGAPPRRAWTGAPGMVAVAIQLDLVQASVGKGPIERHVVRGAVALMRRAGWACPHVPLVMVRRVKTQGDVVEAIVEAPAALAAKMVRHSGGARGVFARPMIGGRVELPLPTGMDPAEHQVVWARDVARYSDVVLEALAEAGIEHAGQVCGRRRGAVGIRMPRGAPTRELENLLLNGQSLLTYCSRITL